jgi:predicted RND superfamily exporter protein
MASIRFSAKRIMLRSTIAGIVDFSTRHRWPVIAIGLIVAGLASFYAIRHFAIDTNINNLISTDLSWRRHELAYEKAFPQRAELTLVVVQAQTPENAKAAA